MLNIAPLDFERLPILVSPLQIPAIPGDAVKPLSRTTEPVAPVGTEPNRHGSAADGIPQGTEFRPAGPKMSALDRDPEHPLDGPHPTDLSWFFQIPDGTRNLAQEYPEMSLQQVTGLYELPRETPDAIMRISV